MRYHPNKTRPWQERRDEWEKKRAGKPVVLKPPKRHKIGYERLAELRSMSYSDYLRTPEWKHTRYKAIVRANSQCERCNKGGLLEVHHKNYERIGHEWETDLIVLCREHHQKRHDIGIL